MFTCSVCQRTFINQRALDQHLNATQHGRPSRAFFTAGPSSRSRAPRSRPQNTASFQNPLPGPVPIDHKTSPLELEKVETILLTAGTTRTKHWVFHLRGPAGSFEPSAALSLPKEATITKVTLEYKPKVSQPNIKQQVAMALLGTPPTAAFTPLRLREVGGESFHWTMQILSTATLGPGPAGADPEAPIYLAIAEDSETYSGSLQSEVRICVHYVSTVAATQALPSL